MGLPSLLSGVAAVIFTGARAPAAVTVTVDSIHREVVVSAGPFDLPPMDPGMAGMHHEHDPHGNSAMLRFEWPVDAYLTGFDVELFDADGHTLPRETLHHLIGVNYDRRQLVYPALERTFGWGSETEKVSLPAAVGVPMTLGQHLGFYVAWHNDTGREIRGARLLIRIPYASKRTIKVAVLPFYVDVRNVIGGVTTFLVPTGRSQQAYEFTVPVSGRMIAIGGHVHDYGVALRLEDAETGKVLVRLKAKRDAAGHVLSVPRFIWGFHDDALPLAAGHRYRVVSEYDNTSGHPVAAGGMGHLNGAFEPDDLARWPRLDPSDPELQRDIAALPHAASESAASSSGADEPKEPHNRTPPR
jgi:hypothetical protein